ncbi:excinuclease ABC subunit UvrC [Arcobacter sp. FWKO B]|uniref:excinuclease ABC subunit UvrC n=1 Tax=Arcobacter sp. FWKO B TaxID=2593672 RepID=UPI0018A55CC6|nr:excinuclease ABC subunit UvrC [Arcobacter sp. FWKO B]QOG11372.1 excinuclease ABC subunit UvrC [Arcobacter sp. FWKO B]
MYALKEKIQSLPLGSGVYQYFDENGKILYVGKAKSLKNRVKSYFKFTPTLSPNDTLSPRIYKMISEVYSLEYIVVPSENDALILENSLIKQLKPKYNILLRDDKTYPYIYINFEEQFPRVEITRKVIKSKNIKYFGPYSVGARDIVDSIYDILPLVQKKSCIKSKKACLFFQIGKCLAPCENNVSTKEYQKILEEACDLISNKTLLIQKLKKKMVFLSEELRFEEAKLLRDKISTIEKSQITTGVDFATLENIDLFSTYFEKDRGVVVKMFIRQGKLVSSSYDFIKSDFEFDLDEIYHRAIIEYYNSNEILLVPDTVLISHEINDDEKNDLKEFLYEKFGKKLEINYPKIGKKKELCDIALTNSQELLRVKKDTSYEILQENIKELFELSTISNRIEVFDNSHMQGSATVGAMVVYDGQAWDKKSYKMYHLEAKDEYAQMKEMLTRRVLSFEQNPPPDLWVIDGGKTLLKLAKEILSSVGVEIDVLAISKEKVDAKANRSKGKANDIIYTKNDTIKLLSTDKRLHFIQKLRDEAHRFAITFHKKTKLKLDKEISLLKIKGIGEAKVKKLLNHFGSFEVVKNSTLDEIKEVLNQKDGTLIFEYFKQMESTLGEDNIKKS